MQKYEKLVGKQVIYLNKYSPYYGSVFKVLGYIFNSNQYHIKYDMDENKCFLDPCPEIYAFLSELKEY